MKLLYIANERIPSERANSIHIVKMCNALATAGENLFLILPKRKNPIKEDIFTYYGIENNFKVEFLPILDWGQGMPIFLLNQIIFSLCLFFNRRWPSKDFVVLTRDIVTSWFLALRGYRVFHDLHGFPEKHHWFWRAVLRKMSGIIATNVWKIEQCVNRYHIPRSRIILARNGFDPLLFQDVIDKEKTALRKDLNLPTDRPVILYSGHLYDWKGAHLLIEVAVNLQRTCIVLVGGGERELSELKDKYKIPANVLLVGQKPYNLVPYYLCAADVLVLPNSKKSENLRAIPYSIYDTSPIKLFEYMASGRPIVASNLPSVREVLNEDNVVLFEPDNSRDLTEKVDFLLQNPEIGTVIANMARRDVLPFSWQNRAKRILNFINNGLN